LAAALAVACFMTDLVLWQLCDDGHDVDAVAREDSDVRMVLEEGGRPR
jgi:hypothetical protein